MPISYTNFKYFCLKNQCFWIRYYWKRSQGNIKKNRGYLVGAYPYLELKQPDVDFMAILNIMHTKFLTSKFHWPLGFFKNIEKKNLYVCNQIKIVAVSALLNIYIDAGVPYLIATEAEAVDNFPSNVLTFSR